MAQSLFDVKDFNDLLASRLFGFFNRNRTGARCEQNRGQLRVHYAETVLFALTQLRPGPVATAATRH